MNTKLLLKPHTLLLSVTQKMNALTPHIAVLTLELKEKRFLRQSIGKPVGAKSIILALSPILYLF
jgi:hypothetical protein